MEPTCKPRNYTLRLKFPCGRTLGLALILFVLLMAMGEALVRAEVFQAYVVAIGRGGRHRQFELQLGRLESMVARDGPVDCLFLGNSMVWLGFDPETFAQAFRQQTEQDVRCFNFGVDGLPAVSAGALAPILVSDYHPSLLIYGTTARDYALPKDSRDAVVLLEMPWLQYRLGQFSIQGWFWAHSRLYQYRETLGHLLRLEKRYLLLTGYFASLRDNYGSFRKEAVGTFVGMPPDPESGERAIRGRFELLSEYQMLPEGLTGLEQIMAQNGGDVQVLIVEMPLPSTYLHFFGNGQQDYRKFIKQVEGMAEAREVPFWQTKQLSLIPDNGWVDYDHMNTRGARIFSAWLGEQVGSAVLQGELENPVDEH